MFGLLPTFHWPAAWKQEPRQGLTASFSPYPLDNLWFTNIWGLLPVKNSIGDSFFFQSLCQSICSLIPLLRPWDCPRVSRPVSRALVSYRMSGWVVCCSSLWCSILGGSSGGRGATIGNFWRRGMVQPPARGLSIGTNCSAPAAPQPAQYIATKYICPNFQMYLSLFQNIFVPISKHICPNF